MVSVPEGGNRVHDTNSLPVSGSTVHHSLSSRASVELVAEVTSKGPLHEAPPSVERWMQRLTLTESGEKIDE